MDVLLFCATTIATLFYLKKKDDLLVEDKARELRRPKPKVIFFDCDDCLYFDEWKLARKLTAKIDEWCTTRKGLPPGKAYQLYKNHGTALKVIIVVDVLDHFSMVPRGL